MGSVGDEMALQDLINLYRDDPGEFDRQWDSLAGSDREWINRDFDDVAAILKELYTVSVQLSDIKHLVRRFRRLARRADRYARKLEESMEHSNARNTRKAEG